MVSNARLDFPEPESPVTTMSLSRGISIETFLRLCTRAPWTAMVVRALVRDSVRLAAGLDAIGLFLKVKKGQLLDFDGALSGELYRCRRLADLPLVGQVFASSRDPANVQIPLEMALDLRGRPRLGDVTKVIDHGLEDRDSAVGQVFVDGMER